MFLHVYYTIELLKKALDQLKDVPCLILLGEPGIGKSSEIGRWATAFREQQQETLNTGLFVSRGSNQLGWVHKSYAEFLAAFYLTQHDLALIQIKELLTQDDRGERPLAPIA